jgi:hypothetical protein
MNDLRHSVVQVCKKVVPALNYLSVTPRNVWGSGCIAPPFLTSALDRGEWSASRPSCFTPGEIAAGAHWIGGWVGAGAGMDVMEKR